MTRCSLREEKITKLWDGHSTEYDTEMKMNEQHLYTPPWMNATNTTLKRELISLN